MKIAIIFFKGIDGCGVTRFGFEHYNWLNSNGHQCDMFSYEKQYVRANAHGSIANVKWFTGETFKNYITALNEYDIVIINSWPSKKGCSVKEFNEFYTGLLNITKPIKVGMMHEIKGCTYNRVMQLPLFLTTVDQIISFDMGVDFFTKAMDEYLPELKPYCSDYTIPMSEQSMEKMFLSSVKDIPFENKEHRLTYFGRWTTMKDPRRLIDIKQLVVEKYDNFLDVMLIGLDWSIGAKADIVDQEYSKCFKGKGSKQFLKSEKDFRFKDHDPKKANVYAAIERELAFKTLSKSVFGASFYKLKENEKHNYGNRMEYTQMELCCLTVPVFDIHWGKNNYHINGKSFYDNDTIAIWSNREDLDETVHQMQEVLNNKKLFNQYRTNAFLACRDCYASSTVIPAFYEKIFNTGKNTNKITKDEFIQRIFPNEIIPDNINLDFNRLHSVHQMIPRTKTLKDKEYHNGYDIEKI